MLERRKIGICALLLVWAAAIHARPQENEDAPESFVLRAGRIYTMSADESIPPVLDDGLLIVREGLVHAVGRDLEVPQDLPFIDLGDEVVIPGLVAANTGILASRGGDETISAKYRALDGFDPYAEHETTLAGGVTTAYLNPGTRRLISGTGCVVKIAGEPGPGRVLREGGDLCVNLGERAFGPPPLQEYPLPATSELEIPAAEPQRPSTRLGQYIEIKETFQRARNHKGEKFDFNLESLANALERSCELRIDARWGEDIQGALTLLGELSVKGYITGALEAHRVKDRLKESGVSVVLEVPVSLNRPGPDRGFDTFDNPRMEARLETAAALSAAGIPLAISAPLSEKTGDLMMAAAAAVRGGLCPLKALEAVTRAPAEILGVAHRVGSLTPGKDADFVVLSGKPLSVRTHVLKVFTSGSEVFRHPSQEESLVIQAGSILTAVGPMIRDGEILIEGGKISAVGLSVPHPPGARVLNAGREAVVTPGFIDGHGHLGLEGDSSAPGTEFAPARSIAVPGRHFQEVAASGVTTVVMAPRTAHVKGSQISAIKTAGRGRSDLIVDELAGLKFNFRGKDPVLGLGALQSALKAGKAYHDSWIKYYEALKKWEEEQVKKAKEGAEGAKEEAGAKKKPEIVVEEEKKEEKPDPISGTWEYQVSGPPLPEPMYGSMTLKLEGDRITGSGPSFFDEEEVTVEGRLEGSKVFLEINVETPMGKPTLEAELDAEDHMTGKVKLAQYLELDFKAERTEKGAPLIKVTTRKRKKKDDRPEPPKFNAALEPYRNLFKGEIPALVDAGTALECEKVIQVFVDEYKVSLGILGGEEAYKVAERIEKAKASVVVPPVVVATRKGKPCVLGQDLASRGLSVILQSGTGDGARTLPLVAGYFVHRGMDPDAVLKALTIHPARFYKIDDRVGSLERGKDADLVIFSGDPFEIGSRVMRVYVSGKEVKK